MTSLIAYGGLSSEYDHETSGAVFRPFFGTMSDFGFGEDTSLSILQRPPMLDKAPYDEWCSDKFFRIERGNHRKSLGRVSISEALVYDNMRRGEIAFTGVQIALSLRENALEAYREFVGKVPVPERLSDSSSWDGGILFVIPTRPFPFPLQRGPADALNGNTREIGKLRPIKSFDFNSVRFFKLQKRSGQSLSYEKTAKLSGDQFGRELHLGVDWKKSWSLWP